MKRKEIFSILLISFFIVQISSIMATEAQNKGINIELEGEIQAPDVDIFIDSIRKFVLHFQSKNYYNNFVEEYTAKLEFPYLKMVVLEDWASKRKDLWKIEGVDGVFDITDSKVHHIVPPVNSDYTAITKDGLKKTVTGKNLLNLNPLWTSGYKGENTRIMVIDTGININHVDLKGRIDLVDSKSFVNIAYGHDVNDPSIEDVEGHGTHCAGIAAGNGTGNPDYIGMAPEAEIVVGRISQHGSSPAECSLAAFNYAIGLGNIDVVSYSFGGGDSEGMSANELAIEEMVRNNIIFVTSGGNEGDDYYTAGSPSSPNSIAVAAVDYSKNLIFFSSRGPTVDGYLKPDVAAPGWAIMSCGIASTTDYVSKDGTSMSCPHIAGATACLIEALKDLTIPYDLGLIKTAMMSAGDMAGYNYLEIGGGIPNIATALSLIQSAPTNGTFPAMIWAVPNMPIADYSTIPQGFHHETYVTSVSSTPYNDLAPVVTGNITTIMSLNTTPWTEPWTKNYYISIDVPDDAVLGVYNGVITFETAAGVTDSTYIKFTVTEGKSKVLLTKFYTNWDIDHYLGQFILPFTKWKSEGIAINEYRTWNITGEKNIITSDLLADYDAIFISDPFVRSYDYIDDVFYPYMHRSLLPSENLAIQQFVADGGGLYVVLLGQSENPEYPIIEGNNITMVNELLNPYDITVSSELFEFEDPIKIPLYQHHAITEGVSYIDHYGTTLSVTGDAQILFKYQGGGTVAVYENNNGGRVVTVTTNFHMDTFGYIESYNLGTQNAIFTDNIINWITAKKRVIGTYTEDSTGVTFNIKCTDLAEVLSASLQTTTGTGTTTNTVSLTDVSPGVYSYRINHAGDAIYKFNVESEDDLYSVIIINDNTPPIINTGDWENNTVSESTRMEFAVTDELLPIISISVTLNGEFVSVSGSGKSRTFNILTSEFIEGDNILKIVATDQAGNKVDATYVIPTSTKKSPIQIFAVLLGLLSLASIATAIKRKRK